MLIGTKCMEKGRLRGLAAASGKPRLRRAEAAPGESHQRELAEPRPFGKPQDFERKVAKAQGRKAVSDHAGPGLEKVDVAHGANGAG